MVALTFVLAASLVAGLPGSRVETAGETAALSLRFVLDDGSWVDGRGPVSRRDGLLVFRLVDGRAASLPADRLADVMPLPGEVAEVIEPADAARVAAGERSDPGGSTGVVIRNRDLPPPLAAAPPPAAEHEAYLAGLEPLSYESYTDSEGRDETWWRERVAAHRDDLETAREDLGRAAAALRAWESLYRDLGLAGGSVGRQITVARREVEAAERRLADVVAEWEVIQEEARVSGALPGWLR